MEPASIGAREKALCQEVERVFESDQVPWLQSLVDQPSHTLARDDVEAAARIIDHMALSMGLNRETVPDPDGTFADHRIFSSPATRRNDEALLLAGHCDTVFPRSQGFLTFHRDAPESESKGDAVRGPGTLDMKSGLSVILFALRALKTAEPDWFARSRMRFVCNTDEEVGSPSSRAVYESLASRTTAALVFEGGRTRDEIITSRKGAGAFTVSVQGVEAHAGNEHQQGVNAIHVLSLLVPRLEALTDYPAGTTVNVGIIEGGTAKNTVPGQATCIVDVRVSTVQAANDLVRALEALAASPLKGVADLPEKFSKAKVVLSGGIRRWPMEATEENRRLMTHYAAVAGAIGLGTGEAPLQGGGSDANLLAAKGVPVIDGLGPYGQFFHSKNEWSSLESLRRRTQALACFLVGFAP